MTDPLATLRALEQELRETAATERSMAQTLFQQAAARGCTDGSLQLGYATACESIADKLAACLAAPPTPTCDCGRALTVCGGCAVEEYQAAHPDCPSCCTSAALGSPSEAWQPIETAPKDGRRVMIYGIEFHRELWGIGYYWKGVPGDGEGWVTFAFHSAPDDSFRGTFNPTHWQPLPAPPARPADTRKDE